MAERKRSEDLEKAWERAWERGGEGALSLGPQLPNRYPLIHPDTLTPIHDARHATLEAKTN